MTIKNAACPSGTPSSLTQSKKISNYVKRYYPDTYMINQASFGSLVMDTVAYTKIFYHFTLSSDK